MGRAALGKDAPAQVDGVRTRHAVRHDVYSQRRINYGQFNPAEAREIFIRDALVGGDYDTRAPFFAHNHKLVEEIENLEHKSRRLDVLVDDQLIAAFYDQLIPADVVNGAGFEKWHKDATRDDPKLLFLNREELMRHEAAGVTTELFPKTMSVTGIEMAADLSLRAGQRARWRDAGGAAVRAEPGAARARRMAGAGHAEGEGAPAAQIAAAEAAPPLRAAAGLRGAVSSSACTRPAPSAAAT